MPRSFREALVSLLVLMAGAAGLLSLGPISAQAQQYVRFTNPETGEQVRRTYPEGAEVVFPITPDPSTGWPNKKAAVFNPRDTARIIVEFRREAVARRAARLRRSAVPAKALSSRLQSYRSRLEGLHDRFRRDLREIVGGQEQEAVPRKAAPMGRETFLTREYTEVFSGAAVTTRQWAVEKIRRLPYVETTYPDRRVEAVVGDARKVVDADKLQAAQGATGEGVEVGIIDTGVDYTHPALGGGFGPGNKVIGGYDFVNEDPDPMDDNGHGTHVAGIVAANGDSITGIAPRAKLRAYKVLGAGGFGRSSDIIAAIEQSVEDSVDVINMSLGGGGTPSSPVSQATDNASRAGVLPVVAAGNSGPDYQTIGAPGAARRALTVGASNDNDQIARFSSRGPTDEAFTVKPDVVAPGVNIRSTLPNGDYGKLSGTSMASPVTAGVAALLLDLHPDWTPTFTKGALMKTGVDLGEDIWTQGHGRVDADSAAGTEVVATPAILSFGLVDNGESTWTHAETLTLRNRGDSSRTYQLSTSGSPAAGVNVDLSATSVTVAGEDSASVTVTAEVNNEAAPFPKGPPPAFTGRVMATSTQDTMEVPYGIVKAPTPTLTFENHEGGVVIFAHLPEGGVTKFRRFRNAPDQATLVLPKLGDYDFMVRLISYSGPDAYLVREGVPMPETSSLTFAPQQAEHRVTANFRDEDGASLSPEAGGQSVFIHKSGVGIFAGPLRDGTRFSSVSTEYVFRGMTKSRVREGGRLKNYNLPYQFRGVSENVTLSNDPEDLRKTTYRLGRDLARRARFDDLLYWGGWIGGWIFRSRRKAYETPVVRELYVLPRPQENYENFPKALRSYDFYPAYRIYDHSGTSPTPIYETGSPQIAGPDTTVFYRFLNFSEGLRRSVDELGPIDIGGQPPRWAADVSAEEGIGTGIDLGWFEGPYAGLKLAPVEIRVYEDGTLTTQKEVPNFSFNRPSADEFGPEDSLTARISHDVGGQSGRTELRFAPGTGGLRPRFEDLRILSGGQVTDTLTNSRKNVVQASLETGGSVDSMVAYIRPAGGSGWNQIGTRQGGGELKAKVPSSLARGHYALRVVAKGKEGGRVEQVADPAFWFGPRRKGAPDPPDLLTVTTSHDGIVFTEDSLALEWNSPFATDVEAYHLYRSTAPIDSSAGPSALAAFDTLEAGTTSYVDSSTVVGKTYYYRVTAVDSSGLESGFSEEVKAVVKPPALTLADHEIDYASPGEEDSEADAGEFLVVSLSVTNATDSTFGAETYARMDSSADKYVHPISAYYFSERVSAFRKLPAGETVKFEDRFFFHVAGRAPEGHVLTVPMELRSGNDQLVGRDTLEMRVEGPDTTPPEISGWDIDVQPGYVEPGSPTTISAFVTEGHRQVSAEATVTRSSDGQQVGTVSLTDDGRGGDREAGDRRFTGTFTPHQESEYIVDISATDKPGNTGTFEGASFTSVPFAKAGNVLLVSDFGRPWTHQAESDYTEALEEAGATPDVWNVYMRELPPPDLMKRYGSVTWYTGWRGIRSVSEREAIAKYLNEGGKLFISGQNIGVRLKWTDNLSWLRQNLKAKYVQDDPNLYGVEGVSGDPVGGKMSLGLTWGAWSPDEIDPTNGGTAAFKFDPNVTEPQSSRTAVPMAEAKGIGPKDRCVWRAEREKLRRPACRSKNNRSNQEISSGLSSKASDPSPKDIKSSGTAGVRYAEGSQRLVYLTFGLETIADKQGRNQLMGRVLDWFDNAPVITESKSIETGGTVDFGRTGVSLDFNGLSSTDSVTVEKYDEAPSGNGGIKEQNVSDFRFVVEAGDRLRFDSSKVKFAVGRLSGIDDPSDVRIYKRDKVGNGEFVALRTTADDNGTPGDISDDTLSAWTSSFSEFVLASNSEPLPVELVAFEASIDKEKVRLSWRTTSEEENAGFAVQRRTEGQKNWKKIGFVESKASSSTTAEQESYRFTDADLPYAADSLSYRLRQIDVNGTASHSKKLTVRRTVGEVQLLKTFPNPARRRATLRFAVPERQEVEIRLYDVLGRMVKTVVDGKREGRHEVQLDVSELASGVYFLRLRAGGVRKTRRLTVVQ